jgi:hypothetical protein
MTSLHRTKKVSNVTIEVHQVDNWDDPSFDPGFVKEFRRTINDPASVKEANQEYTPDSFNDTKWWAWSLPCLDMVGR